MNSSNRRAASVWPVRGTFHLLPGSNAGLKFWIGQCFTVRGRRQRGTAMTLRSLSPTPAIPIAGHLPRLGHDHFWNRAAMSRRGFL
jgi:hypothetical protein